MGAILSNQYLYGLQMTESFSPYSFDVFGQVGLTAMQLQPEVFSIALK